MKWLKWLVLAAFILCLIISKVEEHGFCVKKMAFLQDIYTEEQLIDKAIWNEISYNNRKSETEDYLSVEQFKKINPTCCKLTKKASEGYEGVAYGYVEVVYFRRKLGNLRHSIMTAYIAYDSCGEIINDWN